MITYILAFLLSLWTAGGPVYQPYGEGSGTPPPDTTGIGGDTGQTPPKLP